MKKIRKLDKLLAILIKERKKTCNIVWGKKTQIEKKINNKGKITIEPGKIFLKRNYFGNK